MNRTIKLPKIKGLQPSQIQARLAQGKGRFDVRAEDHRAVIDIYDVIGYWGVSAIDIREILDGITADEILVRINSPGGDVFDGVAIYNDLVQHNARIAVEITGLAASAASIIAMAGEDIAIGDNAFMMIHNAWGIAVGNRHDMTGFAALLERIDAALARTYARRTGHPVEDMTAMMDDETWMAGAEAVEAGFADRTFEDDGDGETEDAAQAFFDLGVYAHTPADAMDRFSRPAAASLGKMFPAGMAGHRENLTAATAARQQSMEDDMDLKTLTTDQLKADRPDLVAAIEKDAAAASKVEHETALEASATAAATAERERVLGVQAHAEAGSEEMVAEMAADGKTTPDQAAGRVLAAQKARRADALANLKDDDPGDGVKPSANMPGDNKPAIAKDPRALAHAATKVIRAEAAEGNRISSDEAVARVLEGEAA